MQFPVATVKDAYKPGARWLSRKAPHLADLIIHQLLEQIAV